MRRIADWLRRVPTWIWVLLTLSQLLKSVTLPGKIRDADAWAEKSHEYAVVFNDSETTQRAEEFATRFRRDLIVAVALTPLFATGAVLSWRRNRAAALASG